MSKTDVAVFKGKTDLAARANRAGQGSENVTANDMAIPRIKLLQAISPELIKEEADYVPGAEAGMLLNSATGELYTSIFALNLHFTRKTIAWKTPRGSGMVGSYENEAEAVASCTEQGLSANEYTLSENPTHLILVIKPDGTPDGVALLDMASTKVKVSKKWNLNIAEMQAQAAGTPRFSSLWEISPANIKSSHGRYFNYKIEYIVDAPDELYQAATEAFDSFFGLADAA